MDDSIIVWKNKFQDDPKKKPNIFLWILTFVFFLQLMDRTKVCQNVGNVQVVYVELATNVHFAKMVKGNSHQKTFSQGKFRKLKQQNTISNFSCMFLNSNIFFHFELWLFRYEKPPLKKAFCYHKLFWPFSVWMNCSSENFKFSALSLEFLKFFWITT